MRPAGAVLGLALVLAVWLDFLETTFLARGSTIRAVTSGSPANRSPANRGPLLRRAIRALHRGRSPVPRSDSLLTRLPEPLLARLLALWAPAMLFVAAAARVLANMLGFAVIAWAVWGLRLDPAGLEGFLLGQGPGGWLMVLGRLSSVLLLVGFGAQLVRLTDAYLRRERPLVRLVHGGERGQALDAESVLAGQLRTGSNQALGALFDRWADWLADIEVSQRMQPSLVLVRSASRPSWLEVAVIMMDAAALAQAVAPSWAPASARTLLATGTSCLRVVAQQLGIRPGPVTVSLHGREERRFADTYQFVVRAGLPKDECEDQAWISFQEMRTSYAPPAAAISQQLHCPFNVTGSDLDRY